MVKIYSYIMPSPHITSKYGWRIHPITKKKSFHYGLDLIANNSKWNRELLAVEDGYVLSTTKSSTGYGNKVWVRYPRIGIALMYAHLKEIKVSKNQKVKKGTVIGIEGKTGAATGVHLHLGMQPIGKSNWMNPEEYDYTPPKTEKSDEKTEDTSTNSTDNTIEALKSQITELNNQIESLNQNIKEKETQIDELNEKLINNTCKHKLLFKCSKNGKYKIKLFKDEILYIESNK